MLILLFLFEKGILPRTVFYVSAYFDQNRDAYLQKLRAIGRRRGAWNEWIEFFLTAVTRQAEVNTEVVREIMSLYERLKIDVIAFTNSKFAVPVLDVLFEEGVKRIV